MASALRRPCRSEGRRPCRHRSEKYTRSGSAGHSQPDRASLRLTARARPIGRGSKVFPGVLSAPNESFPLKKTFLMVRDFRHKPDIQYFNLITQVYVKNAIHDPVCHNEILRPLLLRPK